MFNFTLKKKCNKYMIFSILFTFIYTFEIVFFQDLFRVQASSVDKEEMRQVVETIFNIRSAALVSGDAAALPQYYDTSHKYGQWALEHEAKRVNYLKYWSGNRGLRFTNITSMVRVKRAWNVSNRVRLSLEESYKFDYIYPEDEDPLTNSFGVGIRHTIDLIKKNDKYIIYNDWYTDCFEDALQGFRSNIGRNTSFGENSNKPKEERKVSSRKFKYTYNREKAVQYADKYCGAAWGSGNDFKYNKKYCDYTGIGGDCTNFASQVLGDKDAGGLRQDGTWHFSYAKYGGGSGSSAWVNADGFKDYLLGSGKGGLIKRGTFKELTSPTSEYPGGIISRLDVGDVVCYAKKEDIDHFAVVTGFDTHGYPLVNSHTTDRYHVPWDLGWGDSRIKFYLIHIRD